MCCVTPGELLLLRHTKDVRLLSAPAIVGESALLSMLPDGGPHLRPVTLRAVSPCLLWALYKHDLEHIFEVRPCPACEC
jgi:CRP-like cAMP-binding protein